MSIYSNTGSSVYWNNPDSNFGLNNFGRNNSPLVQGGCRSNNMPMPLSTTYSAIAINPFGGIGIGGLNYGGIGIGISPFIGNGFFY